jgi:hypothetical protein
MDIKSELIEPVKDILKSVEHLTRKPFRFLEKRDLETYAAVRLARSNMSEHIIIYKPDHNELLNHLIAHECGHILRMFSVPVEKRLIPMSNREIKFTALREMEGEITRISKIIPIEGVAEIFNLWFTGIIRQVTNPPPDIMIEKWLYDEYPDLRPNQLVSLKKQHQDALSGLKDQVKEITPSKIFDASNIMNYAFFRIIGFHIKTNFLKPYNQTVYVGKGKELAEYTQKNHVNNYEGDIKMIEYWADYLGLSKWFVWTGFENVPEDYLQTQ